MASGERSDLGEVLLAECGTKDCDFTYIVSLLEKGANVNYQDEAGFSPLMKAVHIGNTELVRVLCTEYKSRLNLDAQDKKGRSALMWASKLGQSKIVTVLLEHGAEIDLLDNNDLTALILASGCGQHEVVEVLLQNGAAVNLQGKHGATALISAAIAQIIKYTPINTLVGESALESVELIEQTLMQCSVPKTIKLLLEYGAKVDMQLTVGLSALMLVVIACSSEEGETVKMLLESGAKVNLSNNLGRTALMLASSFGKTKTAEILLDHDAQIDQQDNEGRTALVWACILGQCETVKVLLERGAQVDIQGIDGKTALMIACVANSLKFLQENLDNVPRLLRVQIEGAIMKCSPHKTAKALLEHGAQVDLQDNDGQSALMFASALGHYETVKVLLDYGAQVNLQDKYGISAMEKDIHTTIERVLSQNSTEEEDEPENSGELPTDLEQTSPSMVQVQEYVRAQIEDLKRTFLGLISTTPYSQTTISEQAASNTTTNHSPNLPGALCHLLPLASKWHNIGVLLNIDSGTLETIENDYKKSDDCLREMLKEWLKQTDPRPTWQALAVAVENFDPNKAKQIKKKHMQ